VEITESLGHLVFFLLVENDPEGAGVVVDLEDCLHGLLQPLDSSPHHDDLLKINPLRAAYLIDSLPINVADFVFAWAGILDHLHGHWRKNSILPLDLVLVVRRAPVALVGVVVARGARCEKASVVVGPL